MKAALIRLASALGGSYWFLPALMALAAILLAGGMVWIDSHVGSTWMDRLPWLYAARPDGARQVLSAIGGSMITVAGTVFSVTIASVVFASGQYGPRLLSNFMSDRGNQVTLGTFIATFVYCLLVLRTIRSPEETGGAGFVPNLALAAAVALALCSIAVMIFFIHHVPSKLHINSVIEDVGDKLLARIDRRFPRFIGEPHDDDPPAPGDDAVPPALRDGAGDEDREGLRPIEARATGYVQMIDDDALMAHAREHDLVLRLLHRPGDFVHAGRALVDAWPADACSDETAAAIGATFAVGARRTALQDLRFLVDELVEIAARALSSGVNDPFTAMTCIDWLGAALSELASRNLPSPLRADDDGALRVVAHPMTFDSFADRAFGTLAPYCAGDMATGVHLLVTLEDISLACRKRDQLDTLGRLSTQLESVGERRLQGFALERLTAQAGVLRAALTKRARQLGH